jgi:hypothetical protein
MATKRRKPKAVKRRKPEAIRKTDQIRVLVSPDEKTRLADAAFSQGQAVGAWLRLVGLQEAARLRRVGDVLPRPS